jgi:hypothetical protein
MNCTLFAVAPDELEVTPETSLPGYHDASVGRTPVRHESSALALGANWGVLHVALGNHGADHPLGFLEGGGEARDEFAGDSSSGRYFEPRLTILILAGLARLPGGAPALERLRMFVADVVISGRGLVVCQFR